MANIYSIAKLLQKYMLGIFRHQYVLQIFFGSVRILTFWLDSYVEDHPLIQISQVRMNETIINKFLSFYF